MQITMMINGQRITDDIKPDMLFWKEIWMGNFRLAALKKLTVDLIFTRRKVFWIQMGGEYKLDGWLFPTVYIKMQRYKMAGIIF